MVTNHRSDGEISVVVTTLKTVPVIPKGSLLGDTAQSRATGVTAEKKTIGTKLKLEVVVVLRTISAGIFAYVLKVVTKQVSKNIYKVP